MNDEAGQLGSDLILTNPPFSLPIEERGILDQFTLGREHDTQEIDILFVERCLDVALPGSLLAIVLPEGFVNTPSKQALRDFVLRHAELTAIVSLPAGAFMAFGHSRSRTCLLFLRKKGRGKAHSKIFMAEAHRVGYECDKKIYRTSEENDLPLFLHEQTRQFAGVRTTPYGGRCIWIERSTLRSDRWDARAYFTQSVQAQTHSVALRPLIDIADVLDGIKMSPSRRGGAMRYIAIPEVGEVTGMIPRIAIVAGSDIGSDKVEFAAGDILFAKMHPWKGRIVLIPDDVANGVCSTEMCIIRPKKDGPLDRYALLASLRSQAVLSQCRDRTRGSSSSRPRIHVDDVKKLLIPVPARDDIKTISSEIKAAVAALWEAQTAYFEAHRHAFSLLGETTGLEERWDRMALEGKSKRKAKKEKPTHASDREDAEIALARIAEISAKPNAVIRGKVLERKMKQWLSEE